MTTGSNAEYHEELARLIFITDNANSFDPIHVWEHAPEDKREYARVIADAIIAAGYRKQVAA
jgi:hypothetical protein